MANNIEAQLSTKAKENLQRNAEVRQRDNKFIKLQSGEKKILQFFPEKIEQVEAEFNGKKTSEEIDSFLMETTTKLKVQRFGSGIDTRYHVIPA